ncbi:hypothetical protein COY62_01955 [bacterium (Candidatus Howlettbacteria) CG_4_10_14_0_8_um_filter_40_9]|nr:MAG: hypothetical protein COY62_01955 [bacterium (Candidatus Howlettbacteria) CG_4_10_14_0_8_um_filter_40_9]
MEIVKNNMNTILSVIGGLAIVAVVVMIVMSDPGSKKASDSTFDKNDENRPVAVLSTKKIDWGEINLNDVKESEVELTNEGNSPLEIKGLSTSCGCTVVKVSQNGTETKEYGMHEPLKNKVSIESKSLVKLKIIYRPYVMPVEGAVTRQVFIETNDPVNPKLEISASAVVKK